MTPFIQSIEQARSGMTPVFQLIDEASIKLFQTQKDKVKYC